MYAVKGSVLVFSQKCNAKSGDINISLARYLSNNILEKYQKEEYIQNNDIIINSTGTGTLGRIGFYINTYNKNNIPLVPDSHVTIVRANNNLSKFIYYILKWYQPILEKSGEGSTKQKELKVDRVKALFIPLPPLAEQKRIVAKIEELLPYIEKYEQAETKLTALNKSFPEMLKKSILQEAVQGKLVPQNPDDEPASILLERIRAEKQELIRQGKIKKSKHESIIVTRDKIPYEILDGKKHCIADEVPFELPDSWCWCRLASLGITQTGNTPPKANPANFGNYIPFIGPGDISNGTINYYNQGLSEQGRELGRICSANSIVQVCIGGSIGKAAITDREISFNQQLNTITAILCNYKYLFFAIISDYFVSYIKTNAGGTATPIISRGLWDRTFIRLPPLSEQHRIVSKIEEFMQYCDKLK